MNCESCTSGTARELARACPGLPPSSIAQLFVQIHVHTACSRMHRHFARSYHDAAPVERKLPRTAKPLTMAAVA